MNEDVETLRTQLKLVANQRDEWEKRYHEMAENGNDALRARLEDAMDAWGWHDEDENRREGYGHHMSQMLARLPRDGQTRDMEVSIRQMLTDLDTALYRLGLAEEAMETPASDRSET